MMSKYVACSLLSIIHFQEERRAAAEEAARLSNETETSVKQETSV